MLSRCHIGLLEEYYAPCDEYLTPHYFSVCAPTNCGAEQRPASRNCRDELSAILTDSWVLCQEQIADFHFGSAPARSRPLPVAPLVEPTRARILHSSPTHALPIFAPISALSAPYLSLISAYQPHLAPMLRLHVCPSAPPTGRHNLITPIMAPRRRRCPKVRRDKE